MQLPGKTVLLTGASGGIGHAIARALSARGAALVLTGRRADVLEPLAAEVGGRAIACDLAEPAEVERLIADAGDVHALVANAALPASGSIREFTDAQIDKALAVNLRAPMVLARRLAAPMVARREGHILFIGSLSGKAASPGSAVYSATKFGLRGFALGMREDLRELGVGVSTVFPGFISDAGMFADSGAELPRFVRTRTPEQVAAGVVHAIERNRAEVAVAPIDLRLGTAAAQLAPDLVARLQRRLGGAEIAGAIAAGQAHRRDG